MIVSTFFVISRDHVFDLLLARGRRGVVFAHVAVRSSSESHHLVRVATMLADDDLALLAVLPNDLHEVFATLFGQRGDRDADEIAIDLRVETEVAFADRLVDRFDRGRLVPRLHGEEARLRGRRRWPSAREASAFRNSRCGFRRACSGELGPCGPLRGRAAGLRWPCHRRRAIPSGRRRSWPFSVGRASLPARHRQVLPSEARGANGRDRLPIVPNPRR